MLHLAGRYPMGGIGWQAVHYLVGLRRLGHDVFYVEDAGAPPYDPRTRSVVEECAYGVEFLRRTMDRFDLGDRWAYWDQSSGRCHGLDRRDLLGLYGEADALLNPASFSTRTPITPPTARTSGSPGARSLCRGTAGRRRGRRSSSTCGTTAPIRPARCSRRLRP
ncbi:MAG: hypothetical protein DME03_00180 [Candidatus Rokuibacteriota bacterium]|nr:MAG: hypothetical protein DME03_00180 [Candidatus Rokubacteria bacterium]